MTLSVLNLSLTWGKHLLSFRAHAIPTSSKAFRREKHDGIQIIFIFFAFYFDRVKLFSLHHRAILVETGRVVYFFFFTSKGQLAILPQLKVTWWLRSHQVGHVALSHIIRSALTRRERWRFSFLDIFILTWDMVKRKMALMTSLWRHVYFDDVKTPFKIFC